MNDDKHGSQAQTMENIADIHGFKESEGYVADIEGSLRNNLETARNGHTVLIPQPSDSPSDTLNWTPTRKHVILFIISLAAFLPDYGSATGAVTLLPQAAQWKLSPDTVNHSQVGNVFMLGAGGVVAVILSAWAGRLPILFYFLVLSTATAACTVAQGGGLMFIFDMFFFHERARKINIWAAFIILSPYMGPLLTAFIITTLHWPVAFWVFFAMTYYDRSIDPIDQPFRGSQLQQLIGISQYRSRHLRNTLGQACMRTFRVLMKPTVLLSVTYYCLTFAWVVGINTTLAIFLLPSKTSGRNRSDSSTSHQSSPLFLAKFVVTGSMTASPSAASSNTTRISNLNYPEASGEVSALINFARTTGGFIISYFQVTWAKSSGTKVSFGTQAGICVGAFAIVIALQLFGKKLRAKSGALHFATA
ncbi:MFS general substrate transporter [Aureobasidium sp. EXF-3400]|nr:MFS general substrate transporter [Aureobasidium sp. EXF-3400]